jgi:hypothetical protein
MVAALWLTDTFLYAQDQDPAGDHRRMRDAYHAAAFTREDGTVYVDRGGSATGKVAWLRCPWYAPRNVSATRLTWLSHCMIVRDYPERSAAAIVSAMPGLAAGGGERRTWPWRGKWRGTRARLQL